MNRKTLFIISTIVLLSILFSLVLLNKKKNNSIITSASILSNKKIEWGVKRNKDHKQPDLGNKNIELIEKYNGIAMGNSEDKNVYLTFDEGYEAGYTRDILDILKKNEVKATFFITGHYLNSASDLVKDMIDEGHIVRKPYSKS